MSTYSKEHKNFLKKRKREKGIIVLCQLLIIVFFLALWELAANREWINTFLSSSPSEVMKTFISLLEHNNLWNHVWITIYETIISLFIASITGFMVASILWWFPKVAKIIDPYLTIMNSLPKVALGPLIIIWIGANTNSIIFMALLISTFITIINIYNGFQSTESYYITLLKTLHASKGQIFSKLIVPSNRLTLISCLKINISMSLIGVIMGELLVSKEGLGYLIMYGSQVFNINLVITSVVILGMVSYIMYYIITWIEKKLNRINS
ncbi:MAG: ABC transporter permease [bacterium]|nr:ABC transporter permease [bacterium]